MTFIPSGTAERAEGDEPVSLLFPAATGAGVRVAVIDSGVFPRHPHIGAIAGGLSIGMSGAIAEDSYSDQLGHGTAVMAAIQEKAPGAAYYAVKVFHESLRTTAAALLGAVDWCVWQRIDVINLSLGTVNAAHRESFERAVARAAAAGTLVVAAREADGTPCYPGCLPVVFGIALDWECPRNRCRVEKTSGEPVFHASGYPRSAPGVPRARNLQGVSFAVANMTGFVARACESAPGPPNLRTRIVRDRLMRECAAIP